MAAPGSLRGPARPPAGPSPPQLQNSRHSLRKEPISTLHSPLHSRGNHISLGGCRQRLTPQSGRLPPGTDAGELGPDLPSLATQSSTSLHPPDPDPTPNLPLHSWGLPFAALQKKEKGGCPGEDAGWEGTSLACFLQEAKHLVPFEGFRDVGVCLGAEVGDGGWV